MLCVFLAGHFWLIGDDQQDFRFMLNVSQIQNVGISSDRVIIRQSDRYTVLPKGLDIDEVLTTMADCDQIVP